MANLKSRSDGLRITVIAFLTLAIATAGVVSSQQAAATGSKVNLWAVPVTSCIDDGKDQILKLKFHLNDVNALEKIKLTLDQGGVNEKIIEFDGNGAILTNDPVLVSISGGIKFKTDGYYFLLARLDGKFTIALDKDDLTIGDHDALAEIFTDGASSQPSDTANFKLKACGEGQPDLVAESFVAPNNIKQDKKYHTYFLESNGGNAKAGPHTVKVYLSSDAVLDTSVDELVGQKHTGALPVNPVRLVHIQVEIPCGAEDGDMFLIAWTDANQVVGESNENNNTELDEVNVIACVEDSALSTADEDDDDDHHKEGKGKKHD